MDIGEAIARLSTKKKLRSKSPKKPELRSGGIARESPFKWLLEGPVKKCIVDLPSELPKIRLKDFDKKILFQADGPDRVFLNQETQPADTAITTNTPPQHHPMIGYKSVSTYPIVDSIRDGDPIADHYCIRVFKNRIYAVIADGCNW
jgi:hypothetical protein